MSPSPNSLHTQGMRSGIKAIVGMLPATGWSTAETVVTHHDRQSPRLRPGRGDDRAVPLTLCSYSAVAIDDAHGHAVGFAAFAKQSDALDEHRVRAGTRVRC